jgi:hypothetical protein
MIEAAQRLPQHILDARVVVISSPSETKVQKPQCQTSGGLNEVIHRMLPEKDADIELELVHALEEINNLSNVDIQSGFRSAVAGIKPRPHAELIVLEHFHQRQLDFVRDEKYIGCSKPSCYCCKLYMQCHPGDFVPRASHGNLWIDWAPPIGLECSASHRKRSQEHPTFQVLQKMLERIRRDLIVQIRSQQPRKPKAPDSTTGVSTIILPTLSVRKLSISRPKTASDDARVPGLDLMMIKQAPTQFPRVRKGRRGIRTSPSNKSQLQKKHTTPFQASKSKIQGLAV